jgi:hypothetical protein
MRPQETQFEGQEQLPLWLATAFRQLRGGGADCPPEFLPPLSALDEVIAIARTVLSGQGQVSSPDRQSLQTDTFSALREIGSHLLDVNRAVIRAFQNDDLTKMRDLLSGAEAARRLSVATLPE